MIKQEALTAYTFKVTRTGGLWPSRICASLADAAGLMLVCSGLTECSVAFAASVHLAAAWGIVHPCALNGHSFSPTTWQPRPSPVRRRGARHDDPGLGIEVDEDKVGILPRRRGLTDMTGQDPIRTIHVGVGRRGRWPLEVLTADPRFMPAALVDVSPELLAEAVALTGLDESVSFANLERALATVQADAVIILHTHCFPCPFARLAFDAGKHVLVEKGMTTNWQDGNWSRSRGRIARA